VDTGIITFQKASDLAKRIGKAEGWGADATNLPTRTNNPGDMELGDRGWGVDHGKTIFEKADFAADIQDHTDGASALRRECLAILSGASHIYKTSWRFIDFAQEWTGGDNPVPWCAVVSEGFGPNATLQEFLQAPVDQVAAT
jgi:hypothetical protein